MNKRIRVTVCAICTLLICLLVTTALAATIYSKASVAYGSTDWKQGAYKILHSNSLSGTVNSTSATGTDNQRLLGKMWTKGVVFAHCRDYASVCPNDSTGLYWANPNEETGTFFAEARAEYGNHAGYCKVTQSGH